MKYSYIKKTKISLELLSGYLKNKDNQIYCMINNQVLNVNIGGKDMMVDDEYNIYWVKYLGFDYEAFFEVSQTYDGQTEIFVEYKSKILTHIFPVVILIVTLFMAYKGAGWLWYIICIIDMYYVIKNILFDSKEKLDFINYIENLIQDIE